jgi:hypothetical protein
MARPRVHLLVTALAIGLLGRQFTWPQRATALAAGVLVDADHLVDYGLYRCSGQRRWLILPLHGWEYGAILLTAGGASPWGGLARAAALGLLLHLAVDQATNRPGHPALYSVLYRLRHRFAADCLRFENGDGSWVHQRWWQWL